MAKLKNNLLVPNLLKRRYLELFRTKKDYFNFINSQNKEHIKALRIRPSGIQESEKIINNLKSLGLELEKTDLFKDTYLILKAKKGFDYFKLEFLNKGKIYIQDPSSMLVSLVIEISEDISEDFSVLDISAAPGSKTVQIADLMNNKGKIFANDSNYNRYKLLKKNLERCKIKNSIIYNYDGRIHEFQKEFDRILVDAPCSGTGVLRKNQESLKIYSLKKIRDLQINQLKLLNNSFRFLKKNGIMVYSTCSLEPEENEICLKLFLNKNPDAKLLSIKIPGIMNMKAPKIWFGEEIPEEIIDKTLRASPLNKYFGGFFIAKITKV